VFTFFTVDEKLTRYYYRYRSPISLRKVYFQHSITNWGSIHYLTGRQTLDSKTETMPSVQDETKTEILHSETKAKTEPSAEFALPLKVSSQSNILLLLYNCMHNNGDV